MKTLFVPWFATLLAAVLQGPDNGEPREKRQTITDRNKSTVNRETPDRIADDLSFTSRMLMQNTYARLPTEKTGEFNCGLPCESQAVNGILFRNSHLCSERTDTRTLTEGRGRQETGGALDFANRISVWSLCLGEGRLALYLCLNAVTPSVVTRLW
jgi:hypothetical protein